MYYVCCKYNIGTTILQRVASCTLEGEAIKHHDESRYASDEGEKGICEFRFSAEDDAIHAAFVLLHVCAF